MSYALGDDGYVATPVGPAPVHYDAACLSPFFAPDYVHGDGGSPFSKLGSAALYVAMAASVVFAAWKGYQHGLRR